MVGPMKQTFVGLLVFLVLQASVPARADSSRCHAAAAAVWRSRSVQPGTTRVTGVPTPRATGSPGYS